VQVFSVSTVGSSAYGDETCSITFRLHESNGEVRVDRSDLTCD